MRIAVLTRDYPPTIGGIATHVEGLVKALRRNGVEVDVYVGDNDVKTLLLPFDIPIGHYDLVHVQSLPYGAFVFGVPLVVTVHSPVLEEFDHYRHAVKVISLPAVACERISLSRASAILAVSERSREDLLGSYGVAPRRVEVIGNGVDYEKFARRGKTADSERANRVLVVSRLEPRKNVRQAIEAVASLPVGACRLDIAGDGSERASLVELSDSLGAREVVRFLGRVDEESLLALYGSASIFVTTSLSEGFGLSLLEAMSSGLACIASDLPTHRALIENGVNGVIYGSKEELVSSLRRLLSSPDTASRLGSNARQSATEHSWDGVAGRVILAYKRALQKR